MEKKLGHKTSSSATGSFTIMSSDRRRRCTQVASANHESRFDSSLVTCLTRDAVVCVASVSWHQVFHI